MAVQSLTSLPDIVRFVRFVLRGNEVRKVTINHSPTSLEIEEVSFRLRELIYKVTINSCFRENLVQIYFYFMKRGVFFLCR